MILGIDQKTFYMLAGVFSFLALASVVGYFFKRSATQANLATITNLNQRINAWWVMCLVFTAALCVGRIGSIVLFALTSFLALREYITLTPSSRSDHRALFWSFFVILPIQYLLVYIEWYGLFSIFIPLYAFLFIAIRIVISGDCKDFLERTARIQWGLMVCVFFVSHVPALMTLQIPNFEGQNARLLFFLVVVVQMSDVLQYIWGKSIGKRKIAPNISPNKTVEGFVGGVGSATLLGGLLWWATPFTPWQALVITWTICMMGFYGGLTMSAIKRARGVKDFGSLIEGHGGMLDRIDSICFAAPIFFHITRYFFSS